MFSNEAKNLDAHLLQGAILFNYGYALKLFFRRERKAVGGFPAPQIRMWLVAP